MKDFCQKKEIDCIYYDKIADVPFAKIENFIRNKNHLQYNYFEYLENSDPESLKLCYVLLKRDCHVVGFCSFQIVYFKAEQLLNYLPERGAGFWNHFRFYFSKSLAQPILPLINLHLLISGNIFMTGDSGFYFSAEIKESKKADYLNRAIEEVRKFHPEIKALLLPDMYAPKTEFDDCLEKKNFYPIAEEADMVMHIRSEWNSFQDYLAAVSSKYRVKAKKVYQLSEKVQMKLMEEEEVNEHGQKLEGLYDEVMKNASFKLGFLPKGFFYEQKKLMKDKYQIMAYFYEDKLISFLSYYIQPGHIDVHYTGMEYPLSYDLHVYQRMLYDMISKGIEHKVEKLHFGRTAPEIKSSVGAIPKDTYGYVKHFSGWVNHLIVAFFSKRLKPVYYNYRSPFKD